MNWLPSSKKLNTRPLPGDGYCPLSESRELDVYFLRLSSLEDRIKTICKELKSYNESVQKLSDQEVKLSAHLLEAPANSSQSLFQTFDSVTKQANEHGKTFIETNKKCVIEPLKRFRREFANLQQEYTKRDQLLKKLQEAKVEVERLSKKERTGSNYVKLDQAKKNYQQLEITFRECNGRLLKESKELYELRVDYFNPSLSALLHAQVDFYGESMILYKELPLPSRSDGDIQSEITASLSAIKKLAITGGQHV